VKVFRKEFLLETGLRFRIDDPRQLVTGHKEFLVCSQAAEHKDPPHYSTKPKAKTRRTPGMPRFTCDGKCTVACTQSSNTGIITFRLFLRHKEPHLDYCDISMPDAAKDFIQEHTQFARPSELHPHVIKLEGCQHITEKQVYNAWSTASEQIWKLDPHPIKSVQVCTPSLEGLSRN
jgi:hypothetical protein